MRLEFARDAEDAENRPVGIGLGEPRDASGQLAVPFRRQIDVLMRKDEDIAGGLADTGIVSGAGTAKTAHDLEVMRAANAWGTGEATLEDGVVVRRGDKGPVHGRRCSISAFPISAFCFRIRSGEHADAIKARGLAQNRVNDAVGDAARDCGLERRPCRFGQVAPVFDLIDRV